MRTQSELIDEIERESIVIEKLKKANLQKALRDRIRYRGRLLSEYGSRFGKYEERYRVKWNGITQEDKSTGVEQLKLF